ncbi:MAG: nickel-responsive transcriptional regulator NikR, partial [Bacteroidales bacterium]|nr:nickel-responsive transcriptional regulator NikR [Bacteroidales bacterium]
RFGVSLEIETLAKLDEYIADNKLPNRSQAIRQLIEKNHVEKKWKCNNVVAGAIVIVYDHHKFEINKKLNDLQHDYHQCILSSQHIHLNHDMCLETIAVKGKAQELTELADKILALKGIQHGKLVMSKAE